MEHQTSSKPVSKEAGGTNMYSDVADQRKSRDVACRNSPSPPRDDITPEHRRMTATRLHLTKVGALKIRACRFVLGAVSQGSLWPGYAVVASCGGVISKPASSCNGA